MPAQLGYQDALDLAQLMLSSPRDWLTRNFEDARLRTALASWGMHVDFSSDICVGAIRPHLVGYGSQLNGMALSKGDAGHVVSPLNLEQFNPDIVGGDQVCNSITCRRTLFSGRSKALQCRWLDALSPLRIAPLTAS